MTRDIGIGKAVVLAAGVGSRLGSITRDRPKCMVEVDGIPVLERNLRWLAEWGVHEAAVNLHYLADEVTTHFVESPIAEVEIFWSYEPDLLGTAGTVTSLRDWIRYDPFLVVYADNLFSIDLEAFVSAHRRCGQLATIALFERPDPSASGVAELGDDGWVRRFIEKPSPGETSSRMVNAGLLAFEPAVLPLIPERGDLSTDVLPRLSSDGALKGYPLEAHERVFWIDTPTDLERTQTTFEVHA
jgi:NDP-sugar pyrophosphorylase family protein